MEEKEYRLIVRAGDQYANIAITKLVKEESIVFAYYHDEFVGMFDLGAVDMLYRNEWSNKP